MNSPPEPNWTRFFPPAGWLAAYRREWLPSDAVAGVTLAAYAIPVSLAYAALAGLGDRVGWQPFALIGGEPVGRWKEACPVRFGRRIHSTT